MATLKTLTAGLNHGASAIPTPTGNGNVTVAYKYSLAAALADNDAIEAMWLPPNHVLVASGIQLRSDELDTDGSPTLTLNVGVSVAGTLDEDAIIDGMTTGAASNVQTPNNVAGFDAIGYSASARKVIITVEGGPTAGATEGDITLEITYRAIREGDVLSDS